MRYEYGINYAGTHTMQWDFQLKRRNSYQSSPTFLCFGSPTAYLRSSIIYSAPCDRIEQKAYLQQLFCCIFYGMVCTWRHQILKSKTKKPPKVLFSSGISTKCISLHLSSLIASFVWKPTHFEFRSYVPVKSKLQHPTPGKPPGIWIFGKFLENSPPPRAEKLFKCPHPREHYQIVLTFQTPLHATSHPFKEN